MGNASDREQVQATASGAYDQASAAAAAGVQTAYSGKEAFDGRYQGWSPIPDPPGKEALIGIGFCNAQSEDPAVCPYIYTLQCELANSYYWTGRCFLDLLYFWCNWHPLLGIFLCHPNHPWTKWERFLQTLVSLALTMVPSAFIGKIFEHDAAGRLLFTLLFVTVPDTIIGVLLYQISIATTRSSICSCCKNCWKACSNCCGVIALVFGAISTLLCYNILQVNGQTEWKLMLGPLVQGKVISFITWFPIWLVIPCQLGFCDLWNYEKRCKAENMMTPAQEMEAKLKDGAE
jgi:hypothetical protein